MKLGQAFDPRNNALTAFRLMLASEVILWHSFAVTGRVVSLAPVRQLLFSLGVDGFFAISGFLVTASWFHHQRARDYLMARALRILPGFYVCLVVTAFVIAPIGVAMQGGPVRKLLLSTAPLEFVWKNSAVALLKLDVGETPHAVPYPGIWNASLWTLIYELVCYLAVAVIGITGLARHRWISLAVFLPAVFLAAILPPMTYPAAWTVEQCLARFAIMFAAGALIYQWRDVIPARWSLVAISTVIVLAAGLLPDYRLIGAIPLAYTVIVSGALIHNKRLRLRTDLSYGVYIYAFPIQQVLVIAGFASLNPTVFAMIATVATLPLAALSWFLVEKPAMSLRAHLIPDRSGLTGGTATLSSAGAAGQRSFVPELTQGGASRDQKDPGIPWRARWSRPDHRTSTANSGR